MNRRANLALAHLAACAALCLPASAAAQDEKPKDDRECLTVELMMFSGRPRPAYLICEDAEKQSALDLIAEADEKKPDDVEFPAVPSDPGYQGILLTLPTKGDNRPVHIFLRKGFLKPGRGGAVKLDKGRKLEMFFLKRSLKEKDVSNSSFKGSLIGDVSKRVVEVVEREEARK